MERLEEEMDAAFRACIAQAVGSGAIREEDLARAKFLIFDAPIAILRPYLLTDSPIPAFAGQMIAELHAGCRSPVQASAPEARRRLEPFPYTPQAVMNQSA
ncbi:hypothetical protein ACFQU7_19265 [Pseudoroseomonas wenyumeiae]